MEVIYILPLLFIVTVNGFNIETSFIDVVSGTQGSYFGYALDFVTHGSKSWLVIGAPKFDDNSANRTGALYQRDVVSRGAPAQIMDVINKAGNPPNTNPGKDHMWFGASIAAAENSVTACAPRWINRINTSEYYMNGLCYVIPSGYFAETQFITPVQRSLLNQFQDKQHIAPDPARYGMTWEYGLGTAGLSVIYDLSSKNKEHTIYGAPGVNEFTGAAVLYKTRDDVQVFGQNLGATYESKMYGYAMVMGQFYGGADGQNYYLALGGPRASGTGEVLILKSDYTLDTTLTIDEPGSYFGSALCAVQRTSVSSETMLLVGAPMYSKLTKYRDYYTSIVEQGAVFVYRLGQSRTDAIQMLQSSKTAKSRFGMAMSDLGDINGDDFHDVVIGAPFEEDGKGVIYIYNGYTKGFLETQRIVGNDIDTSLRGYFGYSFAQNNINFNGDKSNELAVGAFMSDSAVILYTQPVIAMQVTAMQSTNLTAIGDPDMTISACFKYTGDSTILPGDVNVDYKIRADVDFSGRKKRVCMVHNNGNLCDYEVTERNQQIPGFNFDPKCLTTFTVRLTDTQEIRELFLPIVFSIQFNISDSNSCSRQVCPVINRFYGNLDNPTTREVKAATVDLKKGGCGSDNVCRTDLILESVNVKYRDSSSVLVLGPESGMIVDVTVRVSKEPSYNTKIKFLCEEELSYVRSIDVGSQIGMKCSVISKPSGAAEIECDTNPSQLGVTGGSVIKLSLEFDARRLKPNKMSFKFDVEVLSKSTDINMANNKKTLYIPVESRVEGAFDRLAAPEVYVTKKDREKFETMKHIITFFNRGPSNIDDNTIFTVTYPSGRIGGKWVISVDEGVMNISDARPDLQVTCDTKVTDADDPTTSSSRAYKALNFNTMNKTNQEDMNAQYDCRRTGSCNKVQCSVRPIPADSYVLFRLVYSVDPKIYHRAGGQDPSVKSVDLVSMVDIQLPNSVKATLKKADNFAKTEILPTKQKAEPIPSWIIVLAVVGALALIAVIVAILWKCGFFKRKDKEKLLERQKEEEDDKEGTANPSIKVTSADDQKEDEFDPLVQNEGKKISMPDAPDAQGETEDWDEVDELLGDLDEEKTSPDEVKVHVEDTDNSKGNGEMEYAQVKN